MILRIQLAGEQNERALERRMEGGGRPSGGERMGGGRKLADAAARNGELHRRASEFKWRHRDVEGSGRGGVGSGADLERGTGESRDFADAGRVFAGGRQQPSEDAGGRAGRYDGGSGEGRSDGGSGAV